MSTVQLFGLCGAALVGLGLFGLITNPQPLRKILAFNLLGTGTFLIFGVVARRGAAAGLDGDPVPQALVITGIVVAFSATAMAVVLLQRLFEESGEATIGPDRPDNAGAAGDIPDARSKRPDRCDDRVRISAGAGDRPAGRGDFSSFALGGRYVQRIVLLIGAAGLAVAAAVFVALWRTGRPLVYIVGGFEPPLGIALRADGLSAAMMATVAIVICAIACFASGEFSQPRGQPETRAPLVFWIFLLAIWGALNTIVLGDDLFNLYVALELLTFAAVPLVCLKGDAATIRAALRYLLFALFGSVLYLLGVVMIYGAYGTLDIVGCRSGAARTGRLDRGRADDHGAVGEDSAVSVAFVAAAGPRRCAGSGMPYFRRSWSRARSS